MGSTASSCAQECKDGQEVACMQLQAIIALDAPLQWHFISAAYAAGHNMDALGTGYVVEAMDSEADSSGPPIWVYRHVATDIRVLCQAIQFAEHGSQDLEVHFHYTSEARFRELTRAPFVATALWASLKCFEAPLGRGVLAVAQEPTQFNEVLPRPSHAFGPRTHCVPVLVQSRNTFVPTFMPDLELEGLPCMPICSPRSNGRPLACRDVRVINFEDELNALSTAAVIRERRLRRAMEVTQARLGLTHAVTVNHMSALAVLMDARGALDEAEALYRQAHKAYHDSLGDAHPSTLASASNLALLLKDKGSLCEAEQLCRGILKSREETLGLEHRTTLTSVVNLAVMLETQGKTDEAIKLFRRAFDGRYAKLGPSHTETLSSASSLASILQDEGQLEEAERLLGLLLDVNISNNGPQHPHTLSSVGRLAQLLGRKCAASNHLQCQPLEEQFGIRGLSGLAYRLKEHGEHDKAEPLSRFVAQWHNAKLSVEDPESLACMHSLGGFLQDDG